MVRFVAYEDAGGDAGMLAGTRIAIIDASVGSTAIYEWWQAIAANTEGPLWRTIGPWRSPGFAVATTAEQIAAAPARWAVTGTDGTAEATLSYGGHYLFCVIAEATPDMVSGCVSTRYLPGTSHIHDLRVEEPAVYVYLSEGRAYFDLNDGRYRRIRGGNSDPEGLAHLSIISVNKEGVLYARSLSRTWLLHTLALVVADADVGLFWETVHDPAQPTTYGRVSASPAQMVDTGPLGAAELQLEPGGHLVCRLKLRDYPAPAAETEASIDACIYAIVSPAQHHVIDITTVEIYIHIRHTPDQAGFIMRASHENRRTVFHEERGQYDELLLAAHAQESRRVCAVARLQDDEYNEISRRLDLDESDTNWRSELSPSQQFGLTELERACTEAQ